MYGDDDGNLDACFRQRRIMWPFRWRNLGMMLLEGGITLAVGMVGSKVFSVPKFGLGINFSCNIGATEAAAFHGLCSQSIPIVLCVAVLASIVSAFFADVLMHLVEDDNTFEVPEGSVAWHTLYRTAVIMGNSFHPLKAALVSAVFGLGPGIGEEIAFRGVLQTVLQRRLSTPQAIVVQAIVFGLLHRTSGGYMAGAGLVGLVLGTIYAAAQNLALPIFLHALNNSVGALVCYVYLSRMTNEELMKLP